MSLSEKIRESFPEFSILHSKAMKDLFEGRRDLPAFMQSFLITKFTDSKTGVINNDKLQDFLSTEMTMDGDAVKKDLIKKAHLQSSVFPYPKIVHSPYMKNGNTVSMICRFNVKIDMKLGKMAFSISDFNLDNAYIVPSVVEKYSDYFCEGKDIWGRIEMEYVEAEGKRWGYTNMIDFKPFLPYAIADLGYYTSGMSKLTPDERLDAIIMTMGYNPMAFKGQTDDETFIKKHEFCSRLAIAVEPFLKYIEHGPKGTGKSWMINNGSKRFGCSANGRATRADLFYNKRTGMPGPIKTLDAYIIDEISSFETESEFVSTLKSYLETGKLYMGRDTFIPTYGCGIGWVGNLTLSNEMVPLDNEHYKYLPRKFRDSALLDRFDAYIQGWRIPRLSMDCLYEGWALNLEYFSEILHALRLRPEYGQLFDAIVHYEPSADIRDVKAVKKVATAFSKLFFPHITTLDGLTEEEKEVFVKEYKKYCLDPAIEKRGIIRQQCHLLDKEFKEEMPRFAISITEKPNSESSAGIVLVDNDGLPRNATDASCVIGHEKIHLHCIFMAEDEFEPGEKEHTMAMIEEAQEWIKRQAALYGKNIEYVNTHSGLDEGFTVHGPTPHDWESPDFNGANGDYFLKLVCKHFDTNELLHTMSEVGCEKTGILVVTKGQGRSFAEWQKDENEFLGTAVLYTSDRNGIVLSSGIIAHEILHLSGADDLYANCQPAENVAFMQEHYPNEIMLENNADASAHTISPYTAWRLGWIDEKEDWFDIFVKESERNAA